MLTYIDLSATSIGISPNFSVYLLAIANAGSGFGRVSSGFLADKFGAITVTAPLTLLCAIMTYIWPFITTKGGLIAIGIVYGFCSGAYVSLLPVPIMLMGDMHDAGRRSGTFLTCVALGAVAGPPISGAIAQATGGYKAVGYYAGTFRLSPSLLGILLIHLVCRIMHRWRCCISIPHEIPDDRQLARKMLMLPPIERRAFFWPLGPRQYQCRSDLALLTLSSIARSGFPNENKSRRWLSHHPRNRNQ